jgi:hypothetical protein
LGVVQSSDITSFAFNLVYDFGGGFRGYRDFFIDTSAGPRLPPSLALEQARSTRFARQIADVRTDGDSVCGINLTLSADRMGIVKLVEARNCFPLNDTILPSRIPNSPNSLGSELDLSMLPLDETRISFHLDEAGHAKLHFILRGQYKPGDYDTE